MVLEGWPYYVAQMMNPTQDSSSSISHGGKSEKVLVYPYDIRIPKVRISTRQAEDLKNHRCVCPLLESCSPGQEPVMFFSLHCVLQDCNPHRLLGRRIPIPKRPFCEEHWAYRGH